MGKRTRLAWVAVVLVMLATCSMKRTIFEGTPDAAPFTDVPVPATDAPDMLPIDAPFSIDAAPPTIDAPPELGTRDNPARNCVELRAAGMPSAVYWVRHPEGSLPFQVYCEQDVDLHGGGWAMVYNSVRREDGTTIAFWQFGYADRLNERGTLAADQNYYNGALYLLGGEREYMDVFVDLEGTRAVAAVMTVTGFDPTTMTFANPTWTGGSLGIYTYQFASGWSAPGHDGDPFESGNPALGDNCAEIYGNVAQHYHLCWGYNLGSDADVDADGSRLDGGVGPHVNDGVLTSLGLAQQDDEGDYSQVKRITRFTRW
jgi:hypothetical protein